MRNRRLAALVVAAVVLLPVAKSAAGTREAASAPARAYVVKPGDTLWSLAGRFGPDEDRRAAVAAISQRNGVSAEDLVPGRQLLIPAF